jgi:intein/homing endonuclease
MLVTNHVYEVVGCLDASQWIRLEDGTHKNIVDIDIGDVVTTLDGPKPVTETFEYTVDEYVELTFEDGSVIKATPNHKFLIDGVWVAAEDIVLNDEVVSIGTCELI